MSRNVGVRRLIGLMLLGILGGPELALFAQEGANVDPGIAPAAQRVGRAGLTRPDLRAGGVDPNTGQPVDPRIERLLVEWSQRTKEIQQLQGSHLRATRDFTFGTESWAEGRFFVKTPDKGRIDVRPYSKKLPEKLMPRRAPNGQMVNLKVQRDTKNDRWICDGKEIKAINDDDKTYEVVQIPPNQRGENIMDGPLPFLFGMPPERAKMRYQFKLIKETEQFYAIAVKPNWKQDAVDWSQASLALDKKTFLPHEVHLINAAGTSETVYIFSQPEVNRIRIFFWMNPFDPSLAFYKRSVHNSAPPGGNADPLAANKMPSVIGLHYKAVKAKMESLGFTVKVLRGDPATAVEQVYHIEKQEPVANSPLDRTSPVIFTLYDVMADPVRAAAKPPAP